MHRACRNRRIISWLDRGIAAGIMPHSVYTPTDLLLGYASFRGWPYEECLLSDRSPEFLDYLWDHFPSLIIEVHALHV